MYFQVNVKKSKERKMEVVAAPNGTNVPPFRNHDVREWSRIDSLTGVLERARLETDHWSANTSNTSHEYGKVRMARYFKYDSRVC